MFSYMLLQPVVLLGPPKERVYGIMMQEDFVQVSNTGLVTKPETLAELRALVLVKYAEVDGRIVPYG